MDSSEGTTPVTGVSTSGSSDVIDRLRRKFGGAGGTPPPPPDSSSDEDPDNDQMLRMSFLEHLEELRSRIIRALIGIAVAFAVSLTYTNQLWGVIVEPAAAA